MYITHIGNTKAGKRSLAVFSDSPETVFRNNNTDKGRIINARWMRLTGPLIDEADMEEIQSGVVLDRSLSSDGRRGQLAVAEGVTVALPKGFLDEKDNMDWSLVPGPNMDSLTEVSTNGRPLNLSGVIPDQLEEFTPLN